MAREAAVAERCDNPQCDSIFYSSPDDSEGAPGYHFGVKVGRGKNGYVASGYYVLAGGGPIPEFYACSEACIVPAMNAAFARESGMG